MSRSGNNEPTTPSPHSDAALPARLRDAQTPDKPNTEALAHELANLLDGSLRHLGLAISTLREPVHADETSEDLLSRLEMANTAMKHMATLIHRWMKQPQTPGSLFQQSHTIGQAIEHAVSLMAPAAAMRGIDVRITVQRDAAALPAGPIYPIIANALRNSIQAMERPTRGTPRTIDIAVRLERDDVILTVRDTGEGIDDSLTDDAGRFRFGHTTKTDGHGVGLQLSREIAKSLGGELTLANHRDGGALLTLRWPATQTT